MTGTGATPDASQRSLMSVMPFLVGCGIAAVLAVVNESRDFDLWRNYALSGILIGGSVTLTLWYFDARVPHYIQWSLVAATFAHYMGGSLGSPDPYHMGLLGMHGVNGAYHHFDWWDHLTHGLGIGATAMGFAYLLDVYQARRGLQWSGSGIWIVTMVFALAAGVAVELYEYLGKTAFQTIDQGGYENTMRDLHFNFIGAATGAGIAVAINRSRFQQRIQDRWALPDLIPRDDPWWHRTTPGMVGLISFAALPAGASMFLMTRFFWMEIPPDDLPLYDPALQLLTVMTALGFAAGPLASFLHNRYVRSHVGEIQ